MMKGVYLNQVTGKVLYNLMVRLIPLNMRMNFEDSGQQFPQ